jgi:hypothetical protein
MKLQSSKDIRRYTSRDAIGDGDDAKHIVAKLWSKSRGVGAEQIIGINSFSGDDFKDFLILTNLGGTAN